MKKIAIGQAGGPTAVMNASLVGFLQNIEAEFYGVMYGYQGLVDCNFIPLLELGNDKLHGYKNIPGACLGSGRFHMKNEDFVTAVKNLRMNDIQTLVFIGGNGTMWTLHKLSETAKLLGYNLQVIGIPKTVDNDLSNTDHAPGYGSAAKYVSLSVRDISKDLESMKNFEQVRIIETMGRNVGWLAAASGLYKSHELEGPHKIYLPEQSTTSKEILSDIKEIVKEYGFASIVVSEGVTLDNNQTIEKTIVNGRKILGGISQQIAEFIKNETGLTTRDEILGMNQRSSQVYSSNQDKQEAYEVGRMAARLVEKDESNVMVSLNLKNTFEYELFFSTTPLKEVADGGERQLPDEFIKHRDRFYKWLKPIVGDEVEKYPPSLMQRRVRTS